MGQQIHHHVLGITVMYCRYTAGKYYFLVLTNAFNRTNLFSAPTTIRFHFMESPDFVRARTTSFTSLFEFLTNATTVGDMSSRMWGTKKGEFRYTGIVSSYNPHS